MTDEEMKEEEKRNGAQESEVVKATEAALADYHTTNMKRRMRCVCWRVSGR